MDSHTLFTVLKKAKADLQQAGFETWALDAELILAHTLNLTREQLITHDKYLLEENEYTRYTKYINRRLNMEPVQYIIHKSEFMGLELYIDKNVLIPRPDTECMTEKAIEYINKSNAKHILDLCCGSGAIGISIAAYCPQAFVIVSDISPKAVEVAEINAKTNGVTDRMHFIESDMFSNISGRFDVIISNPPYISAKELLSLCKNVIGYEPHTALYGGNDGLLFYRLIAQNAGNFLNDTGRLFLEIGAEQKAEVTDIFLNGRYGFAYLLQEEIKDLAGLDRALVFSKNV